MSNVFLMKFLLPVLQIKAHSNTFEMKNEVEMRKSMKNM